MSHNSRAIKYTPSQLVTETTFAWMFIAMLACVAIGTPALAQTVSTEVTDNDPISDYLDAIETAESELSAYSAELSDLYFGLGQSHFSKRGYQCYARTAIYRFYLSLV